MTRARWLFGALVVGALLVLLRGAALAYLEYEWFAALGPGAVDVWRVRAVDLALLRAAAALAAGAFFFVNLLGVASTIDAVAVSRRLGGIEIAETVPAARLRGVLALVSAVLGVLVATPIEDWTAVDALLAGRMLGEIEPYTGHDLSFFVHWLPFENGLYAWTLFVVALAAGLVVSLYALTPGLRWARGRLRTTARVRRHLTLFGAATLMLLAWGHRLDAYALLSGGSGGDGAFTALDALGTLPARFGLAAAAALAAVVVLRAGWAGHARAAFWTVSAVLVATLLVRVAAGPLTARVVPPAELAAADTAARANRALYTQRAFAGDRVRAAAPGSGFATPLDAAGVTAVWDGPALARLALSDADRRATSIVGVGFEPAAGAIAATVASLAPAGPGTRPDPQLGAARWRVRRVDPRAATPFGEAPGVGAAAEGAPSFDVAAVAFPGAVGDAVVPDSAGAVAGSPLDSWLDRAASALALRDLRLLGANDAPSAERLVRRRDPVARVQTLLPFLIAARPATPVAVGDSLWWAVTVYAASADYPLAERLPIEGGDGSGWTSFRHAATALVNAATGGVRIVPASELDAETRGWFARFRRVLTPAAALPPALAAALPVPTAGALAQAYVFAQYGPRGEHAAGTRQLSRGDGSDSAVSGGPRPAFVAPASLGGPPGVAWSLPLLTTTDRVTGAVIAVGGGDPRTLWFADSTTPLRWEELLDSLAPPAGDTPGGFDARATALRGRLRALPVAGRLLYAQPRFILRADDRPELVDVAALVDGRVVRGPTLAGALGGAAAAVGPPLPATPTDRLSNARAQLGAAQAALRRGDWAAFGRAFDGLGRALGVSP